MITYRRLVRDVVVCLTVVFSMHIVVGATYYVRTNSPTDGPGTDWANAFHSIQGAVDVATNGDVILVTNGTYATGGRAVYGAMTNRVVIKNQLMVRSVNGPHVTSIVGQGPRGDTAVRCAYVGSNACLMGFTITNGHTRTAGDWFLENSGGGLWCDPNGIVSNCVIIGNKAAYAGGGIYGGIVGCCIVSGNDGGQVGGGTYGATVDRSLVSSNFTRVHGGGVFLSSARNCVITGNTSDYGGGAHRSGVVNCTVVGNHANKAGGGAEAATLLNSIVLFNSAPEDANYMITLWGYRMSTLNYCCTAPAPPDGAGNITNVPTFADLLAGDFHLVSNSPGIDAGTNLISEGILTDMDGVLRPQDGNKDGIAAFDMGAYEFLSKFTNVTAKVTAEIVQWILSRQTGTFFATLRICNPVESQVRLAGPFWYSVQSNRYVRLMHPNGTEPTTGFPYVDMSAAVQAQLTFVGNGNLLLDPGECVEVSSIEFYSRDRSTPTGYVFGVWADQQPSGIPCNVFDANTDQLYPPSLLEIIGMGRSNGKLWIQWSGGGGAKQYVECSENLTSWSPIFTNGPPTQVMNASERVDDPAVMFFRIRADGR